MMDPHAVDSAEVDSGGFRKFEPVKVPERKHMRITYNREIQDSLRGEISLQHILQQLHIVILQKLGEHEVFLRDFRESLLVDGHGIIAAATGSADNRRN